MNNNEIAKALDMTDLANAELNPEQQKTFIDMVYDRTALLKNCRREEVDIPKGEVSKLHIGEPITVAAEVNPTTHEAKPLTSKVSYETTKLMSWYDLPTNVLFRNIAQDQFEQVYMKAITTRIGNDLELLAIQGDKTTYAAVNTPIGYLLRNIDGYDLQTESSHVVDAGGISISKTVFAAMYRRLPDQYKNDAGLRWIVSESIFSDWADKSSDRATVGGDDALNGKGFTPYGIPFLRVPMIPSNKNVTVVTATSGWQLGTRIGPFSITTGSNDKVKVDVDNAGAVTVTLAAGVYSTSQIAAQINSGCGAHVATDNGGALLLQSTTTGTSSEIDVQSVANNAYTTLGLSIAVNAGVAAATGDTVPEGTFMWLANPMNLIFFMLKKTRLYTEFRPREDALQVTIYNEVDAKVENLESIVKCINLRLAAISL